MGVTGVFFNPVPGSIGFRARAPCPGIEPGLGFKNMAGNASHGRRVGPHSWEQALGETDWERAMLAQGDDDGSGEDGEDEFHETCSAEEAGGELAQYLVELKDQGQLTAKQACLIAFWARRAGAAGELDIAYPPGRQTGQYSRHFDTMVRRLSQDEADLGWYMVPAPVYRRCDASRSVREVAVYPPHEALADEYRANPAMAEELKQRIAAGELPPCYDANPVKRASLPSCPVFPLLLYVDAVAYSRTDKIIGFWVENVVTGVRTLCCALRRSSLCRCGCRGYCTIESIMVVLRWSFEALGAQAFPNERHDRAAWHATDDRRRERAGGQCEYKACLLLVKCDMQEFVSTFGFPSWATQASPCPLCWRTRANWSEIAGINAISLPWPEKSWNDYNDACAKCEIWARVPPALWRRFRGLLQYDKIEARKSWTLLDRSDPGIGLVPGRPLGAPGAPS